MDAARWHRLEPGEQRLREHQTRAPACRVLTPLDALEEVTVHQHQEFVATVTVQISNRPQHGVAAQCQAQIGFLEQAQHAAGDGEQATSAVRAECRYAQMMRRGIHQQLLRRRRGRLQGEQQEGKAHRSCER